MFLDDNFINFSFHLPIYNWFFPFKREKANETQIEKWQDNNMDVFKYYGRWPSNRSLYFHIPFCQDICAFCPFYREVLHDNSLYDNSLLDKYTEALIKEIELKSRYRNVSEFPITSIFLEVEPHQYSNLSIY